MSDSILMSSINDCFIKMNCFWSKLRHPRAKIMCNSWLTICLEFTETSVNILSGSAKSNIPIPFHTPLNCSNSSGIPSLSCRIFCPRMTKLNRLPLAHSKRNRDWRYLPRLEPLVFYLFSTQSKLTNKRVVSLRPGNWGRLSKEYRYHS